MLKRNARTGVGIDHEFDAGPSIADFIRQAGYGRRDTAVLRPRKTLQTHARVLPGPNAPQRVWWKKICNDAKIPRGHDGTKVRCLADHGTHPEVGYFAQSPVHVRPDAAPADLSLKPVDFGGRRSSLALELNQLGLEFLDMRLTLTFLG